MKITEIISNPGCWHYIQRVIVFEVVHVVSSDTEALKSYTPLRHYSKNANVHTIIIQTNCSAYSAAETFYSNNG